MANREERIQKLISDAQAAIPGLGKRAEQAVELLPSVLNLGDQSGVDWWQVDGSQRVSLKGKSCTCTDAKGAAPSQDKAGKPIGPVCKHRLAVMVEKKLRKQAQEQLTGVFAQIRDAGGEGRLYVNVAYTGKGRADEWAVKGYFIPGQGRVEFGPYPQDWLGIGADELVAALIAAGLRVTGKQKGQGWGYTWQIAPSVPEDANDNIRIGVLGSADAEWVKRKETETFFLNRLTAEARFALAGG